MERKKLMTLKFERKENYFEVVLALFPVESVNFAF